MADNYIERKQADYERRKAKWLLKKKHIKNNSAHDVEQEDIEDT